MTDRVLPGVPLRQWVLSVPFELRLLLAKNPHALSAVGRLFVREVFHWQRERARALGVPRARPGAICFVQRFGGSLNLNVHYHVVIPDGVFSRQGNGSAARFEKVGAPSTSELEDLTLAVEARVIRWLERQGLLASEESASADSEPHEPSALDACLAGSLGAGELTRLKSATVTPAPDAAPAKAKKSPRPGHIRGFDIHAGVVVSGDDSEARERLLRYCARPPLSLERMQLLPNGLVAYALRKPWGRQTHRVLTPLDFLARLAALIPPPRHPLIVFHGVFAPHSAWRKWVVPSAPPESARSELAPREGTQAPDESKSPRGQPTAEQHVRSASNHPIPALVEPPAADPAPESAASIGKRRYSVDCFVSPSESSRIDWAQLLKRTYDIDALACSCGGRLAFIATILEPTVARSILKSLGMEPSSPPIARARSPDWIDDIPVDAQDW